jgi:DNA-binding response OmpR family regulator
MMKKSPDRTTGGRILIVDDDPMAAGMLAVSLSAAGYEISEAYSGQDALTQLNNGVSPDVVFLDIEMGNGIDGYETCRRLRAKDADCPLPVIFLSGHDGLDYRLQAYEAGGSDFMAKPFVPAEVLCKAQLAVVQKRQQEAIAAENGASTTQARIALASLGDAAVTLKYNRGALGCRSLRALADLTIVSLGAFGIICHVQLRTPDETLTLTPHGPASPLEESVIQLSQGIDRIFSFGNRLIVNYDSVSLLVTNMPIADSEFCGRIRDQVAMIAEVAELAVGNINMRTDALMRTEQLLKFANASRQAVEELRSSYRQLQMETRLEFENMADRIESMYVHLALSSHQELTISNTVRGSIDRALTLFAGSSALDRNFAAIVDGLTQAGEYEIAEKDAPQLATELF